MWSVLLCLCSLPAAASARAASQPATQPEARPPANLGRTAALQFIDRSILAAAHESGRLSIWSIDGDVVAITSVIEGKGPAALSSFAREGLVCDLNGVGKVVSLPDGSELVAWRHTLPALGNAVDIRFLPKQRIAILNRDALHIYTRGSPTATAIVKLSDPPQFVVGAKGTLVVVFQNRRVIVLRGDLYETTADFVVPWGPIVSCAISDDASELLVGCMPVLVPAQPVSMLALRNESAVWESKPLRGPTWSAALGPRRSGCATGHSDGVVRQWDFKSGALLHELQCGDAAITALEYSGDGRQLAFGNAKGELQLVNTATP